MSEYLQKSGNLSNVLGLCIGTLQMFLSYKNVLKRLKCFGEKIKKTFETSTFMDILQSFMILTTDIESLFKIKKLTAVAYL
jgi:hypothetical protein